MIPTKCNVQNEIANRDLGMEIRFKIGYSLLRIYSFSSVYHHTSTKQRQATVYSTLLIGSMCHHPSTLQSICILLYQSAMCHHPLTKQSIWILLLVWNVPSSLYSAKCIYCTFSMCHPSTTQSTSKASVCKIFI